MILNLQSPNAGVKQVKVDLAGLHFSLVSLYHYLEGILSGS